jgi:(p)ppGpp synthase/HD superfamily hydrolase
MDEIAEKGYAAHYKYKNELPKKGFLMYGLLKEALENSETNAVDFVEALKVEFIFERNFSPAARTKGATTRLCILAYTQKLNQNQGNT